MGDFNAATHMAKARVTLQFLQVLAHDQNCEDLLKICLKVKWDIFRSNAMNPYTYHKTKKQLPQSKQVAKEKIKQQKPRGRIYRTTMNIYNGIGHNLKASTWRMRFDKLKYYTYYHFLPFVIVGYATIILGAWLLFGDYEMKYPKFKQKDKISVESDKVKEITELLGDTPALNLQENSTKPG